ncbi:MAG TPA: hypothetical protein EYH30_01555 [Anaerolineales bacterium]|nr:hypothetical protein [Anaerolineae bacterium]HIQ00811.1 hypothetical protein [Anaerolineales bacterium]
MNQQDRTIAALFDRLIRGEKATQTFYLRLSEMFAHEPRAAEVWWKLAADEASHIHLLEQAREGLTAEQLAAPADPEFLRVARNAAAHSPEEGLAQVQTLEDAYQLAHATEHTEFNAVFEVVISELFPVAVQRPFVRSQLQEHVDRLGALEPPEWRYSVVAKRGTEGEK